jgi:hypothetical protein
MLPRIVESEVLMYLMRRVALARAAQAERRAAEAAAVWPPPPAGSAAEAGRRAAEAAADGGVPATEARRPAKLHFAASRALLPGLAISIPGPGDGSDVRALAAARRQRAAIAAAADPTHRDPAHRDPLGYEDRVRPHRPMVELTPLSFVPGRDVKEFLGRINLHFIKESWQVKEGGGIGQFFHLFLTEALSVVRANVAALGGDALLMYRVKTHESGGRVDANHIYSMISISGDAVRLASG